MSERRLKILVADDEIGVRQSLSDILGEVGYQILIAANGMEAEQHVIKNRIDLAILDIWMPPGIDGVSLLRRWKDGGLLEFPVIVISAHATLDAGMEAMRVGAKDLLEKPFSSKRLIAIVRQVLATHTGTDSHQSLKSASFGSSAAMTKLKGKMVGVLNNNRPVTVIGQPDDSCEFFARFFQQTSKVWKVPEDLAFLEHNPLEILPDAAHGILYLRGVEKLSATGRRGLYQLITNGLVKKVRIFCELPCPPDELVRDGETSKDLLALLGENVMHVPALKDVLPDLPELASLAVRQLSLREKLPPSVLTAGAVNTLTNKIANWSYGGMARLLDILRAALRAANGGEISGEHITRLTTDNQNDLASGDDFYNRPLREAKDLFERRYYTTLMRRAKGNIQTASKFSGLERTYLYRKIKMYLNDGGKEFAAAEKEIPASATGKAFAKLRGKEQDPNYDDNDGNFEQRGKEQR